MSMADRIAVMADGRVQQIATPVDLYQRPANLFVADFIGTSNRFTGTLGSDGVTVPGLGLLPSRRPSSLDPGSAHVIVRPEDVRIVESADWSLSGTVIDTQFFGGSSTIAVEVPGHEAPVMLIRHGLPTATRGSQVRLAWDPDSAIVLSS
jgi:spermidine/putrescine transport system ATP-binding protein/putrescine transport system ATP-binding protein